MVAALHNPIRLFPAVPPTCDPMLADSDGFTDRFQGICKSHKLTHLREFVNQFGVAPQCATRSYSGQSQSDRGL